MSEFNKQTIDKLDITDERWPILSSLRGPLGDQVLPQIDNLADYYQKNSERLFWRTKTRTGIKLFHTPITVICCGLPTSGKSTITIKLKEFFQEKGYLLTPPITYEDTLAEEHPDLEIPIDFNTFQRIEMRLYNKIISPMETSSDSQSYVRFVEMPVFGRFTQNYREKKDPDHKENRPRGSECVDLLSKMGFLKTLPIHLLALTGNLQNQEEAIGHRHDILGQTEEGLNQYLWDNNLLNRDLVINPHEVRELVDHMAKRKHWDKILEEFGIREDIFRQTIKKNDLDFVIEISMKIYKQNLGREVTVQETITLMRMLTFHFFLGSLGVPEDRIIDAYNGHNPDLKQSFFNNVAKK